MNSKRIILVVGVLAAVGIGVFYFGGLYPPKDGVEGTIGGAKRYQTTQITDQDVVLQDPEVQALLQTDLFHKVATDGEFRKLVQEQGFRAAAGEPGLAKFLDALAEVNKVSNVEYGKQADAERRRVVPEQRRAADLAEAQKRVDAGKATSVADAMKQIDADKAASANRAEAQKRVEAGKAPNLAEAMKQVDAEKAANNYAEAQKRVDAGKATSVADAMKQIDAEKLANLAGPDAERRKPVSMDAQKIADVRAKVEQMARTDADVRRLVDKGDVFKLLENEKFISVASAESFRALVQQSGWQKLANQGDALARAVESHDELEARKKQTDQ